MSLDTKGIYLDEVTKKFPQSFQSLNYDVSLDYDSMYKPKILSTFEFCVNSILALLFMKPGQYPSIPELGINIESYLFEYSDDKTIPSKIKEKLEDQCNIIGVAGIDVNVQFAKMADGKDAILLIITGTETLGYGSGGSRVVIGISYDKLNRLYVRKSYV